jgi:3-phosphoshikimate 1-carboxyvinyltransferase
MKLVVKPNRGDIHGVVRIPPSKYHLHRALIMGSLAHGKTIVKGVSGAQHISDTIRALRDFGIKIRRDGDYYEVSGGYYRPQTGTIRAGSSGSTLQFLLGLGCRSQSGEIRYVGTQLLRRRPIGPLLEALSQMGVRWEADNLRLPVKIFPGLPHGGRIKIPGLLSQWISGLLILAPLAENETVIEAAPPLNEGNYIRLTIQMLKRFGVEVESSENVCCWRVPAKQEYKPCTIDIEADLSSAAFLLVLSALHPADVTLKGVRDDSTHPEARILCLLREMGLPMEFDLERDSIRIVHSGVTLHGILVDMRTIPDLLPILCVAAAVAKGRTTLTNIGPCRLKESNRVKAMLQLRKMGVSIEEKGDALVIDGGGPLTGATFSSYRDHRVEMALAIAGTYAAGATEVTCPTAYKSSYPEFLEHMRSLGQDIYVEQKNKKAEEPWRVG